MRFHLMSKFLFHVGIILLLFVSNYSFAENHVKEVENQTKFIANSSVFAPKAHLQHETNENAQHVEEEHHSSAAGWSVIPFVLLLLMIATGPLFYEHFWHKNYPKVAVILAILVVSYYIFVLHNSHGPIHALIEYVPFISLLSALYIASGGISISIDRKPSVFANIGLLAFGAVIANIIGTTGASMLLIRPYVRLNKNNIRPYHIIFFIFIVSNIGGSLTPIGDPPLFLGFLKGVPFEWTIIHNILPWMLGCVLLFLAFYLLDKRKKTNYSAGKEQDTVHSGKIEVEGTKNFIWLAVVIVAVFLDPNIFDWVPYISYDGMKVSFIKEIIWLMVSYGSFQFASKKAIAANGFSFEPIKEVAFLFIGIFGTMMPAIELVGAFASSEEGSQLITHNTLYWGTGLLSGLLDNAPTYLNFLTAAMAAKGADIGNMADVIDFSNGAIPEGILSLKAIAVASVFFGAMTYIGNGPNFMVKSIAEEIGIKMPSFFGYIIRYSIPVLLPILFIVWLVFFAFI